MTSDHIKYSRGYKHQLQDDCVVATGITGYNIVTDFVVLRYDGLLWLKRGYATDGVTGISGMPWAFLLERKWLIFGSFIHDGLYQLIKLGLLPAEYRDPADKLLSTLCLVHKAFKWQASLVYKVVHICGGGIVKNGLPEILTAP